jgi:ornithine decarboxylase
LPSDIEVLVRLAFRNPSAKSDLSTKFGVDPADAELVVKHVLATGVRFGGFSFHVGSQGATVEPYRDALRGTLELITHIDETLGVSARIIDIGGGFPVSYREPMPGIGDVARVVDDVLGDRRDEFTLLAEPGRFLAADSMTLLTSVVGGAVRDGCQWHYLDDGCYGSYSNVMTEDVHPPILALREMVDGVGGCEPVTLAGPTCDSADVIARRSSRSDFPSRLCGVGRDTQQRRTKAHNRRSDFPSAEAAGCCHWFAKSETPSRSGLTLRCSCPHNATCASVVSSRFRGP